MKKTFTFARVAMTLLLFVAGLTKVSAAASWIGESYIYVNGSWYSASGSGNWASGAFDDYNFGIVTSLTIGGEVQIYDSGGNDWWNNGDWMHYTIDEDDDAWVHINIAQSGKSGNNMVFKTGGNSFTTTTIDISGLSAGEHKLSVYFGGVDDQYDSQNGANYVASFTVLPGAQTVSGGGKGIATYSFAYPLDFTSTSSITAYTVSSLTSTSATLTALSQTVPANTGLIIMGSSESITPVAEGTSVGTNYLHASVEATTVVVNYAYVLSDGAFRPAEAGTIPANKAYLLADDIPSTARSLSLVIDDNETTGISQVANNHWLMGTYYDLSGRRVAQPKKGLYIVNGKKVNIK